MGGSSAFVSLAAVRFLPPRVRAARNRERTVFLIEDLNGAYFTLVGADVDADRREVAIARVRRMMQGCRWMTGATKDAWAYVESRVEDPADRFGPAAVLLTVAGADRRVWAWVAALPDDVKVALRLCLALDIVRRIA